MASVMAVRRVLFRSLALAAGEVFHREREARVGGLGDGGEAAAPVAGAVPGLQSESRAAHFERVVFAVEGEQLLAGFEEGWLTGALEEVLDFGADAGQVAGGGGLHTASMVANSGSIALRKMRTAPEVESDGKPGDRLHQDSRDGS